jgi:hypothetical protein
MGVALGWIVFAVAGVAAVPPTDRTNTEITYTVQYVETEGLGWREAMLTQLKPVARQGGATIWTAPQAVAKRFLTHVTETRSGKIFQAPKVTAPNGGPVHITSRSDRRLVTQVAWSGDDHEAEPTVEKVRTGWLATMVGRRLDQGVLVQLVLEDTEISAVHDVKISEPCDKAPAKAPSAWVPKPAAAAGCVKAGAEQVAAKATGELPDRSFVDIVSFVDVVSGADIITSVEEPSSCRTMTGTGVKRATGTTCSEEKCVKAQGCCEMAEDEPLEDDVDVQQLTIAVPEIRSQEVAGEWLIPKDEVLLVSFGVYTAADHNGKAIVKERLAMISAAEIASVSVGDRPGRLDIFKIAPKGAPAAAYGPPTSPPAPLMAPPPVVVPAPPFNPFAAESAPHAIERAPVVVPALPAHTPMPHPAVPSRTMPEGVHKDGTISKLPPLPDEIEQQQESESSEPMASPQTKKHQQAKPATDSRATKASFAPRPAAPFSIPSLFMPNVPSTPAGLQFLLPIKPFSFKLPFKQRLEIEVFGRLVPDTEPSEKSDAKPEE